METMRVFRLRMELCDSRGRKIKDAGDLARAGAKNGIIREALVRGDTTLSELHGLIQSLFGWDNIHLHRFSLRDPDFMWVTEGRPEMFAALIGALFRYVDDTGYECKRHERCGRRADRAKEAAVAEFLAEESYVLNQMEMLSARGQRTRDYMADFGAYIKGQGSEIVKKGYNVLLDRLSLTEVFTLRERGAIINIDREERDRWKETMLAHIDRCRKEMGRMRRLRTREFDNAVIALRSYQSLKSDYMALLEARIADRHLRQRGEVHKLDAVIAEHEALIRKRAIESLGLTEHFNPEVTPAFGKIYYRYDKGDEWCLGLTCTNIFIKNEGEGEPLIILGSRRPGDDIVRAAEITASGGEPCCIRREGRDLIEDIGGVEGYFNMLKCFVPEEASPPMTIREMAAIYGWQGDKRSYPEIM